MSISVNKLSEWLDLENHHQQITKQTLATMFQKQPDRFQELSLEHDGLLFDFSKQKIDATTINLLCALANKLALKQAINNLFSGEIVNHTEQRPALHTELRHPQPNKQEVKQVLSQMRTLVETVHNAKITDVIVLGIGGSDLGPRLVCEALAPYKINNLNLHFVANVDGDTILPLLKKLDPTTTICIINSKTFTTIETLANADLVKAWLHNNDKLFAVTANKNKAHEYGIKQQNIFEFWDWVGGRYSVWSAVGLPIALCVGMQNFEQFLAGAHAMDQHFFNAEFSRNMPVLMALIGIWNINFNAYNTLAIMPYADGLQLLPAYLQQLEMESNGKAAPQNTAPIIWGGVGCNGQHAYMQLLHQGTHVVPVDFFVARRNVTGHQALQELMLASCLGQSQALMAGRKTEQSYKDCPGDRPSSTIMFDMLTPYVMGQLIALYEHKVFVQGIIWQIQSFDQWGVQLGKDLIKEILTVIHSKETQELDASTAGLLRYFWAE